MQPEALSPDVALFLDVDGTIIDIAATPSDVVVPPALVGDLADLDRILGGALALVSGRTVANLDALFAPLRLKASGVHGAELRIQTGDAPATPAFEPLPASAWDQLLSDLERFPGTLAENKGYAFAVHYRATPESGARLRRRLGELVSARPDLQLTIMPGHYVYELKRADIHKGAAIEAILAHPPFRGRRPVFVGDDVTDHPGFTAVLSHGGLAYAVGVDVPGVSGIFADPVAVRHWLGALVAKESVRA